MDLSLRQLYKNCGVVLCFFFVSAVQSAEPVELREQFPVGYQYHVSTRVDLSGSLTLPPEKDKPASKPLTVTGDSAIEYDERVVGLDVDGQVQKTVRICRRMDFRRKVGENPQQTSLRPEVRRLVVVRLKNQGVPFSPDGPLTWGEIDLVRTDVFTPALCGMLPGKPVQPGDRWTASEVAVQELTALERIEEGNIQCRFEQVTAVENRRQARIAFSGTVRGTNEDGPNRQQLDGYFYFDLESNHLSYLSLKGATMPLDKSGKEQGRIEGTFVLTRQAHQRSNDLTDEGAQGSCPGTKRRQHPPVLRQSRFRRSLAPSAPLARGRRAGAAVWQSTHPTAVACC